MTRAAIQRNAPFWISLAAGIALWEIAGRSTSAAFMVPFTETVVRLWQLVFTREFIAQLLDSATLFLTGFVLALIVGIPLEVLLPYTLPFMMTGVRQAIGRALVGMIAAEFFLSATGLGQLIMGASQNFDTGGVFASILIIGLIGIGLMRLGLKIEQHFARWRQ